MSNINDKPDPFIADHAALEAAVEQYQKDYQKYLADLKYKNEVTLQKLLHATGFQAFYALLAFLSGNGNGETGPDHTPGKQRADGTLTGLTEDRIGLNGDSIAVMSALTKCGNDIEKASDDRTPFDPKNPTAGIELLKQNAKDMDTLLDDTKAGGLLAPTDDPNYAPLDPQLVTTVHDQLRKVRSDIYYDGDTDADAQGSYNPDKGTLPTSPTDTTWVRHYHFSTDTDDINPPGFPDGVYAHSYGQLYADSQIQGQGGGADDKSNGARDAMTTMTNAFQINTNATQTMSSGYNLIANQLSKSDQTYLSFLSEICHADATVKKTAVGNQK